MNRVPSPPPVGKRFEKGVSGNPSGYSKEKRDAVRQLAEIAKERTVEAIETVIHLMLHAQAESVRLKAAEVILDRGWGRAPQHIGGSEGGEPIQIYLKNFVLPEGGNPPMGDDEWLASDEPAVRIR
jgi:hypothetical protein